MTSKISLLDKKTTDKKTTEKRASSERGVLDMFLVGQIIKRHIWLPVLALIGFILTMPVVTAIVTDYQYSWNENRLTDLVNEIFWVQQFMVSAIIMVGAVMAASTMFRYLHVRRQIDFYHSLPVRREKFFVSNVIAGLLVFLMPYLVGVVLNLLMLAVSGLMPYLALGDMLQWVVFNTLMYMLFFACTTFAMMLSGNLPSALKVLTCIFFLAPAVGLVLEGLGSIFFARWMSMTEALNLILIRASVVVRYVMLSDYAMMLGMDDSMTPLWQDWLCGIVLTAGLLAISLVLYKKRASECAGSTLAFGWQKLPYKYPVVLLGGLGLAMFFYAVGNMQYSWLYFGAVFGACFMAMLLEIMIQNDFRAVRQGWKGAIAATVAVCAILSVYVFDLTGYDDRVPETDKIQTVSVYSDVLNHGIVEWPYGSYTRSQEEKQDAYWNLDYTGGYSELMTFSDPDDIAAVMELVDAAINYPASYPDGVPMVDNNYVSNVDYIRVVYTLDNGSHMGRVYHMIPAVECREAYEVLLNSQSFRDLLPINNYELNSIEVQEIWNYGVNNLDTYWSPKWPTDEAHMKFIETLCREQNELRAEEMLYEYPVAKVELMYGEGRVVLDEELDHVTYDYTDYFSVAVYPSMKETMALLREVVPDIFFRPVGLEHVQEVNEYVYHGYSEKYQDVLEAVGSGMTVTTETRMYSDEYVLQATYKPGQDDERITEILENTIQHNLRYHALPLYEFATDDGTLMYEVTYAMGDPNSEDGQVISTQERWLKPVLDK